MGFGYLFVGCFFLIFLPISSLGLLPDLSVIGVVLIFAAQRRLTFYCPDNRGFTVAKKMLIPLSVLSLASLFISIIRMTDEYTAQLDNMVSRPVELAASLCAAAMLISTFIGIHKLSGEVELPKLASRSVRVISVNVANAVLTVALEVTTSLLQTGGIDKAGGLTLLANMSLISTLATFATIFVNLAYIFTCYAHICLEGDEDMPYREDAFDKLLKKSKRNKK